MGLVIYYNKTSRKWGSHIEMSSAMAMGCCSPQVSWAMFTAPLRHQQTQSGDWRQFSLKVCSGKQTKLYYLIQTKQNV